MSVNYEYVDKATSPDLTGIHDDVAASAMTDKNIEWCRWDEDIQKLIVVWQDSLSAEDKALLDTIVQNNS
jgi:hypothetical protein